MTAPVIMPAERVAPARAPRPSPARRPVPAAPRAPRGSGGGPTDVRPVRRRAPGAPLAQRRRPAPARRLPPTGRLGVLWSVVLILATVTSPLLVALVVAPVAFVAALSLTRRGGPRWALGPAVGAALVPLVAVAGPLPAVVVVVLAVVVVAAVFPRAGGTPIRSVAAVAAPGAAAASLVLADHGSTGVALCLASAVCLFDVANYLIGTGEHGGVVGAVAGIVTVAVLAVLVAAVVNPPLSGDRPWVLCGLVAALAPLGVVLGGRLAGDARLPALRRLDSLILAGPAWVIASRILLP